MEPAYTVETAKIVGTPSGGFWSQIHTFFPEDKDKKEKRGDLLVVLVVGGTVEGIEAVAEGREILGRLHEEYYGNLEGSAFERLGKTVEKVSGEYKGLEVIAASLLGRALFLAIFGQGKVLLKRKGEMGIVLAGEGSLRTASGFLEEGDKLVLGSDSFFRTISSGVLNAALESNSVSETVETLAPIILGHEDMADAAAVLAAVKKKEEETVRSETVINEVELEPELPPKPPSLITKFVSHLKIPPRKFLFIRRAEAKKKKILFVVALCFLGILTVSFFFGLRRKASGNKQAKLKEAISLAEEKFREGKEVYLLKPAEGKLLIEEAKKIVEQGLSLDTENQELLLLSEQMSKVLAEVGEEISLGEMPVFMDLNLMTEGGSGISFSLFGQKLAILDGEKKKVYLLDIERKSKKVVDGPPQGKLIASDEKIYVWGEEGISEVKLKENTASLLIEKDENWKEIIGFSVFGGNLYLLDKRSNAIWRYLATEAGFGPRKNWFVGGTPDLSSAVSLAIDGSIWILKKEGLAKFTLGRGEDFSLTKMPESFSEPAKIYTAKDLQNLYVLDKGRKKIFVIAKNGEFKTAYFCEDLKEASDLVAVESAKKIFILSGTKIFAIETR